MSVTISPRRLDYVGCIDGRLWRATPSSPDQACRGVGSHLRPASHSYTNCLNHQLWLIEFIVFPCPTPLSNHQSWDKDATSFSLKLGLCPLYRELPMKPQSTRICERRAPLRLQTESNRIGGWVIRFALRIRPQAGLFQVALSANIQWYYWLLTNLYLV